MNTAEAAGVEIRRAGPGDAALVCDILAEAFADDPVMSWVLGGSGRAYPLFDALARRLYLARGFGHIAGDAGATLWLPASAKKRLSLSEEFAVLSSVLRAGGFGALRRGKPVTEAVMASHPAGPHYYLFAVGVRGRWKGKGLGGRMIRAGLALADAENAPVWLENSNPLNTPLYERLEFAKRDPLPLPAGAPPLLGMFRERRVSA